MEGKSIRRAGGMYTSSAGVGILQLLTPTQSKRLVARRQNVQRRWG